MSCGSPTSPSIAPAKGKVYLCAMNDVFSNRIVGYFIDTQMKARIAVNAFEMAVTHQGQPAGVIAWDLHLASRIHACSVVFAIPRSLTTYFYGIPDSTNATASRLNSSE